MAGSRPIIEIRNLDKFFGEFQALNDVSLTVHAGERMVICGPSGSGKSTLIRCINRLEEPSAGKLVVDGVALTAPGRIFAACARKWEWCSSNSTCFLT